LEHIVIGLVVGFIMGLTGAGGALISIPLFINLLNTNIKVATVLSLIAVILGTSINLFKQHHKFDTKLVINFVIFGSIANLASLSFKAKLADSVIAFLLVIIVIYSNWAVWKKRIVQAQKVTYVSFTTTSFIGLGLGIVTMLTGLGGGVLLVPILMSVYRKNYEEAVPTSLLTILCISLMALLLQFKTSLSLIGATDLTLMALGTFTSFYLLQFLLKRLSVNQTTLIRKIAFTLVSIYSITIVILRSL
jgi:uncharacterized protein